MIDVTFALPRRASKRAKACATMACAIRDFGARANAADDPATYTTGLLVQGNAQVLIESATTTLRLAGTAPQLGAGILQCDKLSAPSLNILASHTKS